MIVLTFDPNRPRATKPQPAPQPRNQLTPELIAKLEWLATNHPALLAVFDSMAAELYEQAREGGR